MKEMDWVRELWAGPTRGLGFPGRKVDERSIQSERAQFKAIQFKQVQPTLKRKFLGGDPKRFERNWRRAEFLMFQFP